MWSAAKGCPASYTEERISSPFNRARRSAFERLLNDVGGDTNHPSVLSQALAIARLYIAKRDIFEQEARSGPHAGVPVGLGASWCVSLDAAQEMRLTAILPEELGVRVEKKDWKKSSYAPIPRFLV